MKVALLLTASIGLMGCQGSKQEPFAQSQIIRSCDAIETLSEQQRSQICRFYRSYAQVLEKKNIEELFPFISDEYRGADGLNAQQIKQAMKKQIASFPWSGAVYEKFESHGDFSRATIIHTMNVRLPDGKLHQVKEGLTWSKGKGGRFGIINWRHKL